MKKSKRLVGVSIRCAGEARPPRRSTSASARSIAADVERTSRAACATASSRSRRSRARSRVAFASPGASATVAAQRRDRVVVPAEERAPRSPRRAPPAPAASPVAAEERRPCLPRPRGIGSVRPKAADVREVGVPVSPPLRADVPHVVPGEDARSLGVEGRLDEELVELAPRRRRDAAAPLEVAGEIEPARPAGRDCRRRDHPELDRLARVDEQRPFAAIPPRARSRTSCSRGRAGTRSARTRPDRRGRERPDRAGVAVARVEEFAAIGPARSPAASAVDDGELRVVDPGEAAAGLAHGEPDPRVRDDVDPRPRRPRIGDDVLAPVVCESARRRE